MGGAQTHMIDIKNAAILDILPDTFLTAECKAFSAAVQRLAAELYKKTEVMLFWGDIENASSVVLDAMAAELDAPFYASDLPVEQKRSIIAASFAYNSRIGTVGAVQTILNAAFGGGEITEWSEYGGKPYHFKLNLPVDFGGKFISRALIENFYKMLEKAKNKRSKLDEFTIETIANLTLNIVVTLGKIKKKSIISTVATEGKATVRCSGKIISKAMVRRSKTIIYPAKYKHAGYNK